jgi:hypothetical protein
MITLLRLFRRRRDNHDELIAAAHQHIITLVGHLLDFHQRIAALEANAATRQLPQPPPPAQQPSTSPEVQAVIDAAQAALRCMQEALGIDDMTARATHQGTETVQ